MSTTSASRATPSSSASNDNDNAGTARGIKVATPDYFYGDRNKLEEWLLQFDLYFTFQGSELEDDRQVPLMATYMRGTALAWIKPALTKYMTDDVPDDVRVWMEDFEEFKKKIRVVFGSRSEVNIATRNIQTLKQTRSVADYANQFQQYSLLTEWDDKALMTMFRQGLKNDVKIELMRSGASLDTLDDVINEAIDIDTRLYELSLELRPHGRAPQHNHKGRPPHNNQRQYRSNNYANRSAPRVTHLTHDTYGAEPMVLDNINKGRSNQRTRGGRGSYQGNNSQRGNKGPGADRTCYNCGKPGHIARNCRSQNTNKVTRQINVLTREPQEEDTDEWDIISDDVGQLMLDEELDEPAAKQAKNMPRSPTPYRAPARDWAWDKPLTPPESPEQKRIMPINVRDAFYREEERQQLQQERKAEVKYATIIMDAYQERIANMTSEEAKELQHARAQEQSRLQTNQMFLPTSYAELQYMNGGDTQPNTDNEESDGSQKQEYQTPPEEALKDGQDQALVNYEKGLKEWSQTRRTQKKKTRATIKATPKYYLDARNPKHAKMSWTTCYHDYCPIHYSDKQGADWNPAAPYVCSRIWWECHDDTCAEHLWDKRESAHFPGKHDNPREAVRMNLTIDGSCTLEDWHRCLNPDCRTHWEEKKVNGFGNDTFLGQHLAPGITPDKLIPSATTPSSNSQ
jgi:hypothetical protein